MRARPDCPWPGCDAADTLEEDWVEMGTSHCHCTCCGRSVRVDSRGEAHTVERKTDVSGNLLYE